MPDNKFPTKKIIGDTAYSDFKKVLMDGCQQLSIALSEFQQDQLLAYHQLLVKWNKAYNLTAVRDPVQMISRHLLDSLSIASLLTGKRFIDVGTGAGLPGVVLAIVFPDRQFELLDSAGKKMRFLFQVKSELKLDNITIHNGRVETYQPQQRFDGVISRAFASLADMATSCGHLLREGGLFFAMKGQYPKDELIQLKKLSGDQKNYNVEACHVLQIPGDEGERHLLVISQ